MSTNDTVIVVVDSARARSFRLLSDDLPGSETCKLDEGPVWVHPEARVKESERFVDSTPRGGHSGGSPGQAHTLDDHRGDHEEEERRRFASQIASELEALLGGARHLVVCATHAMVSHLNAALERLTGREQVRLDIVTAELTGTTPHELHEALAARELIPAPRAPRRLR